MRQLRVVLAVLAVALASPASAETLLQEAGEQIIPEQSIFQRLGTELALGGGVTGFLDGDTTDVTSVGGMWDVRVAFGTKQYAALEIAYVGSAHDVDADELDPDADLLGGALEVVARGTFFPDEELQPYAFAGVGWQHYDVVNEDFNRSIIDENIDAAVFPLGLGLAFKAAPTGFFVDGRVSFRLTAGNELFREERNLSERANLHTWAAIVRFGWQF